ncbi:MAG: hypothetical protein KF881_10000 [Acidobacteria bacterium]|nr:hypothetical protein [Acidobacteriota bacterium]
MMRSAISAISTGFRTTLFAFVLACIVSVPIIGQNIEDSIVLVLAGDGDSVVKGMAPGVVLSTDGAILVPHDLVKSARRVQVRLRDGEIFDDVKLVGVDERRGVAVLRIRTTGLFRSNFIEPSELTSGLSVGLITHDPQKLWLRSQAKITEVGLADDFVGAGSGYRVARFAGKLPSSGIGGVLFSENGHIAAIVTRSNEIRDGGFAVPVSGLVGMAEGATVVSYSSGNLLKIPSEAEFIAQNNPSTDPKDLFKASKTIWVDSRTSMFKEHQLINELQKRPEIKEWGWNFLSSGNWNERARADLVITLDHQILTFDFTYTVHHRKTDIVLTSGKVVIGSGAGGAPKLVTDMIRKLKALSGETSKKTGSN